ncbi:MAG: YciI family protein [Proteobacteria bacterium]|nr:YciI family protein [Pseudomonadota bacterium]
MQFLVTAYDGTDDDAQTRRKKARDAHIEGAKLLKKAGNIIAGGAILNEDDQMIGSTLYVEFESKAAVDQWLQNDPYVTGGVWQDIEVLPIRLAIKP